MYERGNRPVRNRRPAEPARYGLVIFVLSLTTLMSAIDTNIVNIGLPTIEKALNADFTSLQWVVLGYLLAVTSLIVGIGRIGDIFGKKRIFLFGIGLFTFASFLCGVSGSIYELIAFRILQGVGGSALMALSFAIAGDMIPKEKILQGMAILTVMLPTGFALGPSVGGLLIGVFGWRSIFFLNVPVGAVTFLSALRFPAIPVAGKSRKLDVRGLLLLAATLVCYVLSVTLAENQGLSKSVLLLAAGTAAGIAAFLFLEKRTEFPLVDLKMFRNRVFSASLAVSVLLYTTMTGAVVILPFYLQQAKGLSPFVSGIMMMAGAVGCALLTPLSSIAANRFGDFPVIIFGITAMGIGSLFMSAVGLSTTAAAFSVTWFFFNGCLAFFQTPNNASIIAHARPEQRGLASALLNLARTIGLTTGAAVIGAAFYAFAHTTSMSTASPRMISGSIHDTFLVTAGILACALAVGVIALRPDKAPAAESSEESPKENPEEKDRGMRG